MNLRELPPFYVDPRQPGIVRGGWASDEFSGILVGLHAQQFCDMLNYAAGNMPEDKE